MVKVPAGAGEAAALPWGRGRAFRSSPGGLGDLTAHSVAALEGWTASARPRSAPLGTRQAPVR